jgi:hypothetical protein
MSKVDNPYDSLVAKTPYEQFLKKELVDLHNRAVSKDKTIKTVDHLKDKRAILGDAIKTKYIDKEQYKKISSLLEKNPEKIDIIKEIQKHNKEYSKSTGKGIDSDIMGYLNQF